MLILPHSRRSRRQLLLIRDLKKIFKLLQMKLYYSVTLPDQILEMLAYLKRFGMALVGGKVLAFGGTGGIDPLDR